MKNLWQKIRAKLVGRLKTLPSFEEINQEQNHLDSLQDLRSKPR